MPSFTVTFAKIVGSPTNTNWSQVYTAGSLYAVLSLAKEDEEKELSLSVAGKGILNNIEAEFFTLEDKSLNTIKEALGNALSSTSEDITVSLALGYLKDDVMYLFTVGNASVLVKRDGKTGVLLKGGDKEKGREIHAGSGYGKEDDVFLLYTHAFEKHVSEKAIIDALELDSINDAEEELMPHVHDKEAGDAAAILVRIGGASTSAFDEPEEETEEEEKKADVAVEKESGEDELEPEPKEDDTPSELETPKVAPVEHATPEEKEASYPSRLNDTRMEDEEPEDIKGEADLPSRPSFSLPSLPALQIPNKKMLILGLALLLAVALGGGILMAQQSREAQKTRAQFQQIFDKAQKEYEVGESLEELNKAVAADNFLKAKKTIDENKGKFKEGSDERKQLDELLAKIQSKVGDTNVATPKDAKEASATASTLLTILQKTGALAAAKNDTSFFYLTKNAIFKTNGTGEDKDEAYKNDDDWSDPKGLGAFGSNLYVLDQGSDVLKLSAGGDGYGVSSYFKGGKPDLDDAEDLAIDSSIYILFGNGSIQKFTRGEKDSFSISALAKPLKNPTKIVTNEDMDNIYVLDTGNSRIVSFDKSGVYKNAYATPLASKAKAMDVNEGERKIYLLSGNKIYEISM